MKRLWPILFPLVRPSVLALAAAVALLLATFAALWGVRYYFKPQWQQAETTLQAAQAQWDEAQAEQSDARTHGPLYERMVAAGLVGGEPRAAWVEDLLGLAKQLGLQERTSFTLAAPEVLELPLAAAAQARVQRHVLEVQLTRVHEIEALHLLQQLQARHALVSRLAGCVFEQPTPEGLSARCRVNFLHIDPAPPADNNASKP